MEPDDYDIAGFSVGIVDRKKIINGAHIAPGDVIIGLPSSGLHSNGFSLVRKLFFDMKKYSVDMKLQDLDMPLGEALLVPTVDLHQEHPCLPRFRDRDQGPGPYHRRRLL